MKFKKVLATILAAGLTMTCFTACDLDEDYDFEDDGYEYEEDEDTDETGSNAGNSGNSDSVKSASSMQMSVDQESGSVDGTRVTIRKHTDGGIQFIDRIRLRTFSACRCGIINIDCG